MASGADGVALVWKVASSRVWCVRWRRGVWCEHGDVGCFDAVVALCTKITIDKEKRLSEDHSPFNHTYSLYTTGLG